MSCISHDGYLHEENEGNEKEEKKEKIKKILFIISILIFAFSFVLPVNNYIKIGMYVATILLAGYEIIVEGILNIFKPYHAYICLSIPCIRIRFWEEGGSALLPRPASFGEHTKPAI